MIDKMDITIVYIDDDNKMREDAFLDDVIDVVNKILYFDKPLDGISYIENNINENIVVILDWKFANSSLQGDDVLKKIESLSVLIPVIVFTGARIDATEANKMFNGKAFSCIPKDATTETIVGVVCDAYDRIKNDIRFIIEKWILKQDLEKRNKPYMRSDANVYTLNDILYAIRKQDQLGKETTEGILRLAAELFTNNMRKK